MAKKSLLHFLRKPAQHGVTPEQVQWCYRSYLQREPESEAALKSHLTHPSLSSLVQSFMDSQEYRDRIAAEQAAAIAAAASAARAAATGAGSGTPLPPLRSIRENEELALAEHRDGVLYVQSTPRMITLETTSRCNLRCVMCPHAINAVDRPKHLEEGTIEGLQRFLAQARSLQLHGIGEPLASPAFWRSLAHIPGDCDASINTNLTVLDDKRLQRLVGSNIRVVNVSLDAATALTYRRIRDFDFDTVVGNIRRFMTARQAAGRRTPMLYMNMTLMRSNIEEVPAFVHLAADLGADRVCLWHLNRWPDAEMQRYRIDRDGWHFDYATEGLWNHPALSNRMIREAQTVARERGIGLYLDENKDVFFLEEPAATTREQRA